MEIDKAQKIHDLMEILHENEKFLKDLNCNNVEPEVWLRANDGSVFGVASRRSGNNYQVEGLKDCLIEHFEFKIQQIKSRIKEL